ncbi:MAG TPA: class I adenylate-forming enzyme family protein [Bryobacteraceae bacterium]|nr:class I adenylate-forming enzyme family protein [Bryobacteraceae bacterium]
MATAPIPLVTAERFETEYRDRHLIHAAVDWWAARKPGEAAVVNATRGATLTWGDLERGSLGIAAELARMGFRQGDFLAASLPLLNEHILLELACFRLGVIHAPLDLRLPPAEAIRCLNLIRPKGYFFPGKTAAADFAAFGEAARGGCDSLEHLVQFSPAGQCIAGAQSMFDLLARAHPAPAKWRVTEGDPAQAIFTTGSTGSPKPALLSHRGIACQNVCLGTAFRFGPGQRVLCNLPASHVGGQAEVLLTSLFMGATAVTLETFDAAASLDAMERHGVTLIGQIPAMFNLEWRTADYGRRNLASLQTAVYGGQAVPRAFLERMLQMAPRIATGLGLTESSGFCSYTRLAPDAGEVEQSLGWAMPAYRLSIREPMDAAGAAGREMNEGQVGHICFQGPQTFLGYVNDAQATAATVSRDGWLYTGDLGFVDPRGLHFSGRAKWVLKPAGHQVFPGDIENHFAALSGRVANAGVVGHEHRLWSEGIVAFVERQAGADLTEAELRKHARRLAGYMRPLHYVILEPGAMPLNRSAKVDVVRLREMAREEVAKLRERGRWDG